MALNFIRFALVKYSCALTRKKFLIGLTFVSPHDRNKKLKLKPTIKFYKYFYKRIL